MTDNAVDVSFPALGSASNMIAVMGTQKNLVERAIRSVKQVVWLNCCSLDYSSILTFFCRFATAILLAFKLETQWKAQSSLCDSVAT